MILSPFVAFFVATIAMLLPLVWYAKKNPVPNRELGIDLSNPIYMFALLYFLSFCVGYVSLYSGYVERFSSKPFSYENDLLTLVLSVLVFFIFIFGFYIVDKSRYGCYENELIKRANSVLSEKFLLAVLLFVTLIKLFLYAWYFGMLAGLPTAQLSFFYGKGYVVFLFSFFLWFCIVLLIAKLFLEVNKKSFIVYAILLIFINMLISNFLDGSRRYFIMPIMLTIVMVYMKNYIKNKHIILASILLFFVLVFLRLNQNIFYDFVFDREARSISFNFLNALSVMVNSFDSFWHSNNVFFKYPIDKYSFGIIGFQSITDIFVSYIPRSIWPSKPDIYGDLLMQNMVYPELFAQSGFNCGRFPLGFVGYAALSFGVIGLILFPLLTGGFYGVLQKYKLNGVLPLALFLWFFGEAFNIIRGGFIFGLLQQLVGIALSLFLLYMIYLFSVSCSFIYKKVFTK